MGRTDPVSLVGMSYWFIQSLFVEEPQIKYTHACKSGREGGRDRKRKRMRNGGKGRGRGGMERKKENPHPQPKDVPGDPVKILP